MSYSYVNIQIVLQLGYLYIISTLSKWKFCSRKKYHWSNIYSLNKHLLQGTYSDMKLLVIISHYMQFKWDTNTTAPQ